MFILFYVMVTFFGGRKFDQKVYHWKAMAGYQSTTCAVHTWLERELFFCSASLCFCFSIASFRLNIKNANILKSPKEIVFNQRFLILHIVRVTESDERMSTMLYTGMANRSNVMFLFLYCKCCYVSAYNFCVLEIYVCICALKITMGRHVLTQGQQVSGVISRRQYII